MVDLTRARAAMGRLEALLAEHPELGERTARYLAVADDEEEALMGDNEGMGGVPVKLPAELIARADALIAAVEADRELGTMAGGRVSRAAVVRLGLLYGLDALEAKLAKRTKGVR